MQETTELSLPLLKLHGIFMTIKSLAQKDEIDRAARWIESSKNEWDMIEEFIDESYMVFVERLVANKEEEKRRKNKDKKSKSRDRL